MSDIQLKQADSQTRKQILDISQSYIVQAPAGSGKTECLTQRYLALLADGVAEPEEIIAITFTRKATQEMRSRILTALQMATEPMPSEVHKQITWKLANQVILQDQKLNWNLLSNPQRMRITTIDSLCASLVKQMPLTTEFGGLPDIVENAEHLYLEAAENLLQQLVSNGILYDELFILADYLDNDLSVLQQLIVTMLKSRSHWKNYLIHQDFNKETISYNRSEMIHYFVSRVKEHLDQYLPSLIALLSNIDKEEENENPFWWELVDDENISIFKQCQLLAQLLLTQKGEWRKKFDKKLGFISNKENKAIIQDLKILINEFQSPELLYYLKIILASPAIEYTKEEWQIINALMVLLPIALVELRTVFKLRQQVDFVEVSLSAISALTELDGPTQLALHLDYQIKHLLVDEFQDTSILQYQLLCQLTLGWEPDDQRSLFLVGDPMQSIYRFREAEVSLFKFVQKYGLPNVALTPINLYLNFRSSPELVTWVNQLCQQLFPPIDKPEYGEIAYVASTTLEQSVESAAVEHHLHTEVSEIGISVASICQETLKNYPQNQIAILVRSRNHIGNIEQQLRKNNLDYCVYDTRYETNPVIQDLIALTCALVDPCDRVAWLACLRAPYLGLSLKEITAIIDTESLHISAAGRASNHPQLQRFFAILDSYEPLMHQLPIGDWLETIWEAIGGYQYDQTQLHYNICRGFFSYLQTIPLPITREKLIKNLSTLQLPIANQGASIHILTIHKAKGLEFDTVIIPHCEKETSSKLDKKLLMTCEWYHPEWQKHLLLIAPCPTTYSTENSLYRFLYCEEQQKYQAELQRLFYVAITRAKSSLHFVSHITADAEKNFVPPRNSFLSYLLSGCDSELKTCLATAPTNSLASNQPLVVNYLQRCEFSSYPSVSLPSHLNTITDNQFAPNVTHLEQSIGMIVHRFLQYFSQVENVSVSLLESIKTNLPQICLQAGVDPINLATACETISTALFNCLNDTTGLWILTQREQAFSEYSLYFQDQILRLDRTFCYKNEQWIIDYKIIKDAPGDKKSVQATYGKQLTGYAKALKEHIKLPIQCGIYFPLQQQFYHWAALDSSE